jgi:hypothetical protein
VVGYGDEVWWSRFAQPRMHAWTEQGKPLRLQELKAERDDSDPKAICCYGLLRDDTNQMLLRFVDGRPVSHVSTAYLHWSVSGWLRKASGASAHLGQRQVAHQP